MRGHAVDVARMVVFLNHNRKSARNFVAVWPELSGHIKVAIKALLQARKAARDKE